MKQLFGGWFLEYHVFRFFFQSYTICSNPNAHHFWIKILINLDDSPNLIILIQNDQIGRNILIAFCLGFAWITSRFLIISMQFGMQPLFTTLLVTKRLMMLIVFCLGFAWITSRFLIRREERKGKEGKNKERKRKGKEKEKNRKGKEKESDAKQSKPAHQY